MKKIVFFLLLLNFLFKGLFAQNISNVKNDSIIFEKVVHDYGTIVKGSDGNSTFNFTNKGQGPLILNNVKTSCGCTVPEWPSTPIPPGRTGIIKVKYDTNRLGTFSKAITVNSNAKNSPVTIIIKGNIINKQ
ncbi:MAG: DUF1573 domain-containing protein [Bacteroidetes bacterium]|jgi:hypothetical protein|nr:DUF1573 domain-containing protein [Bacteroidota bacterium]